MFGKFLDDASEAPLDHATCALTMHLISSMSDSFINTTTKGSLNVSREFLGDSHPGKKRGGESARARRFREDLLTYLHKWLPQVSLVTGDGQWQSKGKG